MSLFVEETEVLARCATGCREWILPAGQACALHINGSRLSHVVSSQDWLSSVIVTSTHSPDAGSGCLRDQNPKKNIKITLETQVMRKNTLEIYP